MTIRADDNWLQRRYFAWAEPHYRRMPPVTRAEVERIDRWLYSRRGAVVWFCLAMAIVASVLGLTATGMPWLLAVALSLVGWLAMPLAVLGAWLQPERFVGRKAVRIGIVSSLVIYAGAALGFFVGRISKLGGLETATLWPAFRGAFADVAPLLALAALGLAAAMELTAFARRRVLRADLERARLIGERDAAARQAAEARLRLLQGQIRPHFIFNTLASLQHWVDTGDARAGPLLRSLTGLLRTSTEAMAAPFAPLGAECDAAGHYLAIMRARLGERLAWRVEVAADCADVEVPAGLVLSLVENAVEHGIEPMLAGGSVTVTVFRDGPALVLQVDDDGVGLADRADSADVTSDVPSAPGGVAGDANAPGAPTARGPDRPGVGLANSRERLRHRYDGAAMLELSARPGARGTRARVRIDLSP
ncbi:MAG: histidine kinase [Caldimonas sp.]